MSATEILSGTDVLSSTGVLSGTGVMAAADAVLAAPNGKAGPVALFVIVLLCVVAYFLFRSMSTHLRRVPEDFAPPTAEEIDPAPPEKPGGAS